MKEKVGSDKLFIGGAWSAASATEVLPVEDPSYGQAIGAIPRAGAPDIDRAVAAAADAMRGAWGNASATERGRVLTRMGQIVSERLEALAALESRDVGKPLKQARADAAALARYFEFYGGAADKIGGAAIPYQKEFNVFTVREPHGVTGHIIPWNYPMQMMGRSVGAALAMGNAAVLKPAEDASLTALALARIAEEAGLPAGALNVVTGLGEEAGAALAGHPGVRHISFTGSFEVGQLVQAAAARHVAPVTLELGGKSPQIVFDDAPIERALPVLVNAAVQNAGQTCSAGSRILVQRARYARVVESMAEKFAALCAGPAAADLDLGPLISAKQKGTVESYIARGRRDGLRVAAEGAIAANAPNGGHYVRPILFADAPPDHALSQEEIFGPVAVVMPFDDEEQAVSIANGTGYGLVAGVWTQDGARQLRMARALRAGQVFINNYGAGGGVELPFGGVGKSGHGREKGLEALYGFSTLKTIATFYG